MAGFFKRFARVENGNTLIDWIVLAIGTVLMLFSLLMAFSADAINLTDTTLELGHPLGEDLG